MKLSLNWAEIEFEKEIKSTLIQFEIEFELS